MNESGTKAVFLSYASQDADAARRICEAMRACGVEVWFDQSELRGGDAWDQKIRRQIKECALFVPIISAGTQARREGYFRLEWRLAVERMRHMDDELPFLVPVLIDETRDADAFVPERFREVQWTRLRRRAGGAAPDDASILAFCARLHALLEGGAAVPLATASGKPGGQQRLRSGRWDKRGYVVGAAIAIAVVAVALWQPWQKGDHVALEAGARSATPKVAGPFPRDPELKRAWDIMLAANEREEFALAEDIVKTAAAGRPTDPETTIVYAWVNNGYLNRGFDLSEERHVLARRYAERAVQLAPNDPEALAALGQFLSFRRADLPRAEQLLRRAIELKPGEPRFHRALAWNVLRTLRPNDALLTAEHSAALFPGDALVHYELGMLCNDAGRLDDMERAFDRSLAIMPTGGAMIWKAWLAGWVHGDLAAMKQWIERIPPGARLTGRAVVMLYQFARLTQDPVEQSNALRALQAFPGTWLRDFWFTGPKALMIGELFLVQQKPELAKGQFELALADLAREKAANPADRSILTTECWTLMALGRRDEARATLHLLQEVPRVDGPRLAGWWHGGIAAALLLGDRAIALDQLRAVAAQPVLREQVCVALRIDPRMAAFREDREIAAVLAEPIR